LTIFPILIKFVKMFNQQPGPEDEAIITPRRGRRELPISPRLIMTFTRADYLDLCRLTEAKDKPRAIADCPIREGCWQGQSITIAGPALGAPYAVLVLEKLIAWGARLVLTLGWCGSLQGNVKIGDLVLPESAYSEEGTSTHYPVDWPQPQPDADLAQLLHQQLAQAGQDYRAGAIWTTDAFYRETTQKVKQYGALGILAVEMEMSALFTVSRYRSIPLAGLLVVSDELATLTWRHGFREPRLLQARQQAARIILDTAVIWEDNDKGPETGNKDDGRPGTGDGGNGFYAPVPRLPAPV
jgi:uridine phosphorylase